MPASSPTRTISRTRPIAASSARPTSTARSPRARARRSARAPISTTSPTGAPGCRRPSSIGVRHPYVEAGIDKATVRALARQLGLDDLAELPAAPCLSSRLETGMPVTAERLELVHAVERLIQQELAPRHGALPAAAGRHRDPARSRRRWTRILSRAAAPVCARRSSSCSPGTATPARALPALPDGQRLPPPARRMADITFDFQRRERIGLGEAVLCAGKTRGADRRGDRARPGAPTPRCC